MLNWLLLIGAVVYVAGSLLVVAAIVAAAVGAELDKRLES